MQRKCIHYGHPEIVGIYYYEGNVYFENLDCKSGKVIIMVSVMEGRTHNVQGSVKTMFMQMVDQIEDVGILELVFKYVHWKFVS